VGSRKRNQPAPPHVVFEALTEPDRDPQRPWLSLLDDEQAPHVVASHKPDMVVWSSLFTKRPDAVIRFDLPPGAVAPICVGPCRSTSRRPTTRSSGT